MKICLIIFLVLFLLGIVLLFLPVKKDGNPESTLIISLLCMGLFGFLAGKWPGTV
ncbi:MAG: hypothetical protein R2861_12845 [Desulfobacterales bacterium]